MTDIDIESLPPIPDDIYQWDGDVPVDAVTARWWHPDTWKSPDKPVLHIYQGVIGELLTEDQMALDLAAEYLESCGWTILDQDTNKDWAWYDLAPPPPAEPA